MVNASPIAAIETRIAVGREKVVAKQWEQDAGGAHPPADLNAQFSQLLQGYKGSIPPDQWQAFMGNIPSDLRQRLTERYAL